MASVLVVEPWYGGSHRVWLDGWRDHSRHDVRAVTLPDRFWRWRMRAGAVDMAALVEADIAAAGTPDAVVVSSLIDASVFAGLTRRTLAGVPMAVYMHENQLLYPTAPNQRGVDDLALANWRSLLAADAIWWNSDFHRDALLGALPGLLQRQPEPARGASIDVLRQRSTTLPPGVALHDLIEAGRPGDGAPAVVLWNQRWDHDKNPRAVFAALAALAAEGIDFDLVLAGEDQRHDPDLEAIVETLARRVRHRGHLGIDEYRSALLCADVVVSAADHEFFGIAIVEALAAGAIPVLPNRLSFPELVGSEWADAALYPDGDLRRRLRHVLMNLDESRRAVEGLRSSMARFDVVHTSALHDAAVENLIDGEHGGGPT